jgi:hypothetical protein
LARQRFTQPHRTGRQHPIDVYAYGVAVMRVGGFRDEHRRGRDGTREVTVAVSAACDALERRLVMRLAYD